MKRPILLILITFILGMTFTGCMTGRKYQADLRGLMLQDNLQMKRNRAFYSKHNAKLRKQSFRHSGRSSRIFGSKY